MTSVMMYGPPGAPCGTISYDGGVVQLLTPAIGCSVPAAVVPLLLAQGWTEGVPYTPPWSGVLTTSQQMVNQRQVCAFDWFTPAQIASVQAQDGLQDVTAAIQAAFTNAPAGCNMIFPRGRYVVSGATQINRTVNGDITFEQGAWVDATTSTVWAGDGAIFVFKGTIGTWYVNAAAMNQGDLSITVDPTLAASLSQGDMLRLSTSASYGGGGDLWGTGGMTANKGELAEVSYTTGAVVTLKNALYDSYAAGHCAIARVAPIKGTFTNINMVGGKYNNAGNPQGAVNIVYGKDISFVGGNLTGWSWAGIVPSYTLGFRADGVSISDSYTAVGGYNYGICLNSSQSIRITRCRGSVGRHWITCGGWEPTRDVRIFDCDLDCDTRLGVWCLDAHSNSDFISVEQCTLRQGCMIAARNWSVRGSRIIGTVADCIGANSSGSGDLIASDIQIENNFLSVPLNGSSGNTYPIRFRSQGALTSLTIRGNRIEADNAPMWLAIGAYTAKTLTINDLQIDQNYGYNTIGNGIELGGTGTAVTITNTFVRDNYYLGQGGSDSYPLLFDSGATTVHAILRGNVFYASKSFGYAPKIPASAAAVDIVYQNNSMIGTGGSRISYGVTLVASSFIDYQNNYHEWIANGAYLLTAPTILITNPRSLNVNGAPTLVGKVISRILNDGTHTESIGTASPTVGVYGLGDRIINSAGVIGQPKGWQTTTAGGAYSATRADATPYTVNTWIAWATGTTVYECTTAGISTTGAPAAATSVGQTVTDGTVTWTCRSLTKAAYTSEGNL